MARNVNTLVGKSISNGDHIHVMAGNYLISCDVVKVTEKAVQVSHKDTNIKVWFPKSALIIEKAGAEDYDVLDDFTRWYRAELAGWFKGDIWLDRFINAAGYLIAPSF